MNGLRKTIAVLILLFIGVPVLISIIWAVGVTRTVVSPEFLSDLPREIIKKIPIMMDETVTEINRGEVSADGNTRAWTKAISETGMTPGALLEKIGLTAWMKNDLSKSLEELGKVLRGEIPPKAIYLDLRPLKAAMKNEQIILYIKEVLKKLPPCSEDQMKMWETNLVEGNYRSESLPACQPPDVDKAAEILRNRFIHDTEDMDDEVDILNVDNDPFFRRHAVNITHIMGSLSFLLFLIPAIVIGLSALIATSSGPGILRWMGTPTLICGAFSFGLSKIGEKALETGIGSFPFSCSYHHHITTAEKIFTEKAGDIFYSIADRLFSSVDKVSGIVCIVGILLIALSYAFMQEKKRPNSTTYNEPKTQAPEPQSEPESQPLSEPEIK